MQHRNNLKTLGRRSGHRKSLFVNLCKSLIQHEQISTTEAKAKALRPIIEKLITSAKEGSLHRRRKAISYLQSPELVSKLFSTLAKRYENRMGGYTRIIKTDFRKGDNAPMALIQFVDRDGSVKGVSIDEQLKSTSEAEKPAKKAKKQSATKTVAKKADAKTKAETKEAPAESIVAE